MANKKQTDREELKALLAKAKALREKIEKSKKAKKPKPIMDKVKSFDDILKIAKPTKEELALLNYKGKSKRMQLASDILPLALIAEVLNEGEEVSVDDKTERYFPYFQVSSGFVFDSSDYYVTCADASSASRLALKSRELSDFAGKKFKDKYEKFILNITKNK